MEMEKIDFNFDSACTSPYISAPSSPQHFGTTTTFFYSAPTSPTRISALHRETKVIHDSDGDTDTDDFAFEFSGHELEKSSIVPAADELFYGGKIKPLINSSIEKNEIKPNSEAKEVKLNSSGSSRHKPMRSLSPMRVSDLLSIDDNDENIDAEKTESSVSSLISLWNRTWKLKDLLLFRSASESRASGSTEELDKYELVKKARQEDAKKVGSSTNSGRRRRRPISAHELHYKMKRDVLKEMKKKTFLPYKQSLLSWHGCSGFDDTISVYVTPRQ
ncbi:hypothetical protein HAX54_039848 [Datura stramonium]|uniref:Uncharacterized protein n=1 Tax=Datura stramonium TaxID=4076 RepID=A0ABS8SJN4_DATST|nr:hypothetical protein [Datura stramonium]